MKRFIANLLIILGITFFALAAFSVYERINPRRVSFAYDETLNTKTVVNKDLIPVVINIPSINVSLPIIPSLIKNGKWEATEKGVSYLSSSPVPGTMGNSILYGHNWVNLLGALTSVKPGDSIEIVYDDKSKKTFEVEYTVTVNPTDTHILLPSKDKRITLYTCTGFLDSKRFVVVGILKEIAAESAVK